MNNFVAIRRASSFPLLCVCFATAACRDSPVEDTLAACDDYLGDHHEQFLAACEREDMTPLAARRRQ